MTIKEEIEKLIREAVGEFGGIEEVSLEHPENAEHGDYATSVAFVLAKQLKKSPQELARLIVETINYKLKTKNLVERIEAVGGFVNFYLSQRVFEAGLQTVLRGKDKFGQSDFLKGKRVMVEYAHPNTHKEMHIGHMRTLVTGESLARIFEAAGAEVFRANYQGDIGPHVAKAISGIEQILKERGISWQEAEKLSLTDKAHLLGEGYVRGNQDYEQHKEEIDALNAKLYSQDKTIRKVYKRTRKWSLDYYDALYKRFGTTFDKLYFESEVAEQGKKIVLQNVGKVFEESKGAVIFDGEPYGLHKRVFITKDGNPTYEGKEMGLAPLQGKDFRFHRNIHVVASEQAEYFRVVFKALELIDKKFQGREYHLPMGMVQLVGKKMSSRAGVIITVDDLLNGVKELLAKLITSQELTAKEKERVKEVAAIAAVKYSVLKADAKSNVLFDMEKSVALDGNSGPYLLYTYARCRSILRKSQTSSIKAQANPKLQISKEEKDILRTIYKFPEVVQEAAEKYAPSLLCNFAFDLAQKYNAFYNAHSVLQAGAKEQKQFRLALTAATAQLLANSLHLLGIQPLEKM